MLSRTASSFVSGGGGGGVSGAGAPWVIGDYTATPHVEFIEAFCSWFPGYAGHDDLLDAGARGLTAGVYLDSSEDFASDPYLSNDIPALEWERPAP